MMALHSCVSWGQVTPSLSLSFSFLLCELQGEKPSVHEAEVQGLCVKCGEQGPVLPGSFHWDY